MATIAITGSAGGIGQATSDRLTAAGHRVIGVDVRDADVLADLSTGAGRSTMVSEVTHQSGGTLDGLVVGAGITGDDGAAVVSINYFGAIAALEGLRPLLEHGTAPSVVVISSNSTTTQPGLPVEVAESCLTGDEAAARAMAGPDGIGAYGASKLALGRWVRHHATQADWIGAGIRLNAIAPGFIDTPLTEGQFDFISSLGRIYPMPTGRAGRADEVAGLLAYLLSPEAAFFVGSFIVMDGGTEAALRPDDWPRPIVS